LRFFLDEGLPCGPITIETEGERVTGVDEGAALGVRPATQAERQSFWDHFWHRGPFIYSLDMSSFTPFETKVLVALATVPVGERVSYKELAVMSGHPRAYRAVGSTMARNPFPILLPCHRVVKSGGDVGSYGFGGPETKEKLLEWEAGLIGHD